LRTERKVMKNIHCPYARLIIDNFTRARDCFAEHNRISGDLRFSDTGD